ncbi:MAG: WecB/TagA/CpsF family glycosyltransferase [Terracidiphilus sp.]|jgi:exopolysaccharide biosynthesis WecB/TagA/CpsF family protein
MIDRGKHNLLGVQVNVVDYEAAVGAIMAAAREGRGFAVSALAVHGVMTGAINAQHRFRLNSLDLVTPDGQPVRWALNLLYKAKLTDRVYGPNLTLKVMQACERERIPIYLYGTTESLLTELRRALAGRFPDLEIAGCEPSRFGPISKEERAEIALRIRASGAKVTFVGIGCPRQEIWACELRSLLSMPILAVGAAFAFVAGLVPQAPGWMQSRGLEWLFRLAAEPTRLWKRYILLNPLYIAMVVLQVCGRRFSNQGIPPGSGPIPG